VIVILSTALSSLQMEIAHGVPFADSGMNFLKVMELEEIDQKNKLAQGTCVSVPLPDSWQSATFVAFAKIVNPFAENKI
jgi:hypothetical protein